MRPAGLLVPETNERQNSTQRKQLKGILCKPGCEIFKPLEIGEAAHRFQQPSPEISVEDRKTLPTGK